MSKVTKLFKHPVMFFEDAKKNKELLNGRKKIFVVGFSTWKTYLRNYFSDCELIFLAKDISTKSFHSEYAKKILLLKNNCEVFIWGMKAPSYILDFARENNIKLKFVEDGFIRSVNLGATKAPPLSLSLDSQSPYFDATKETDLERLLNTYDFSASADLLERGRALISVISDLGVSKYNASARKDLSAFYGPKLKKRVLVLGQVEDDASIQYGLAKKISNNELVKLAVEENPDAQVIYKPHPDVLAGHRAEQSDPADVSSICQILTGNVVLKDALLSVDHVYTLTSLAGFESLLHGVKNVTTMGTPFYSGWGVTDDRQKVSRRQRNLTVEEIFVAAYLLYPKYFDSFTGQSVDAETVVAAIVNDSEFQSLNNESQEDRLEKKVTPKGKRVVQKSGSQGKVASVTPKKPAKTSSASNLQKKESDKVGIPDWFQSEPGAELSAAINSGKPVLLYVPWITEHSNALINAVGGDQHYALAPLDFISDLNKNRRAALWFARENPDLYRKMIAKRLIPIMDKVAGIVFTFDWPPVMRVISHVCEELSIPRILIPHESVFVNKDKYYWDPRSYASQPLADVILGWGELQKSIFVERGFPESRFVSIGAPKFDKYVNYKSKLTRKQFYRLFGLDENKKTILYASQPLDSQLDTRVARESQRQSIKDLMEVASDLGMQLIVRLPPSKDDILGAALNSLISESISAATDDALCYLVTPEDALEHTDVVASVNSTMLFEGLLMGRMPLSTKYVEFEQIWENCNFPIAKNAAEIRLYLEKYLDQGFEADQAGLEWAANQFSNGAFDGLSSQRIKNYLRSFVENRDSFVMQSGSLDKIFNGERLDLIGIHSPESSWEGLQKHLPAMLNANQRVFSGHGVKDILKLASVDVFVQWGISPANTKKRQRQVQRALGRQIVFVEDGFIRSVDIGLSKEPGLSIILDDTTSYYDAYNESMLERKLNSEIELTSAEASYSNKIINKIVSQKVSKYNNAPILPLSIGSPERKKILLVDQRYGDQSVEKGMANETNFERMLYDAVKNYQDYDIIIKQHPDAISGGKQSYFSNDKLSFCKHMDNVYLVDYDINPYCLFDIVEEVFVVTSGLGFEALMAGKEVNCYGVPFYSNWGLTNDQIKLDRRTRYRKVVDLFHMAYIELSRYCNPGTGLSGCIEDVVDYIVDERESRYVDSTGR